MTEITAFAPAKINLFLHVGALASDAYHPLSSWMVFADVGDTLTVEPAETDSFQVWGPLAAGVPTDSRNLVLRARNALGEIRPGCAITLNKRLPASSGMGGGSSDAAAALRALGELWSLPAETLKRVAPDLGADVPACLRATSLIARGRGELLTAAPSVPDLHAVLINPGIETSTGQVFAVYDAGPTGGEGMPGLPEAFADLDALITFLAGTRNDLQAPAVALHPEIGEVLAALSAHPESRFARMSGSGATCFALCNNASDAGDLALGLQADHPDWWIRPCQLFTNP